MRHQCPRKKISLGLVKCVVLNLLSVHATHTYPTFGGTFESDGRLQGDLSVQTVDCPNNICQIHVPAPNFALVFFTDSVFTEVTPSSVQTFSTSVQTRSKNTVTVDPAVLATSNGHSGTGRQQVGSTSVERGAASTLVPGVLAFVSMALGTVLIGQHNW